MLNAILLFRDALYGALVIGVACSALGVYVVLRRIVFVGAALAQMSSAGVAPAMWPARPPDASIGVAYAVAAALGILLIAKAASGEAHDIFLSGNILGITRADTFILLAVTVPVLLLHAVFYKEFLFVSFDRETARTLGFNVAFWNVLLYMTLGVVIAFAMQFAGVMLVFNFLVLPAVTGLLVARTMAGMFAVAVASGLLAALIGFSLSVPYD